MEGPSVSLAAERLQPFIGKKILRLSGNTKIGKERLAGLKVVDIFSWGKHLVFQFERFAMRTHFMLFGTYEATVAGVSVTGDYKRKVRKPRLKLSFSNGHIEMYNCSIKWIESSSARETYDFSVDTMSASWDSAKAIIALRASPQTEIGDALLDQDHFAGVGNIIRNEVLWTEKIHPERKVSSLSLRKLHRIVGEVRGFSMKFHEWRKAFTLRKHLSIYQKHVCPRCGAKVVRVVTGRRKRISYYCPREQVADEIVSRT
jgi:endonuclease-8